MMAMIQRFHFQGLIRVYSCPFAVSRIRVSHRDNPSTPRLISHASVELHSPGCTLLTSGIATCDIDLKSGMGTLPIISRFRFVCEPFRCLQFSHQAGAFDVAPREVWIVRENIFYVWHTPDDIPY